MENIKKFKTLRIVTVIQTALILAGLIFILLSGVLENKEERLLIQGESENGAYVISVYEVGKPNWFRSNTVKAYYSDVDHRQGTAIFTAEVNNGKAILSESNYHLEWEGDTAVLYLSGNSQTGMAYKINFETAQQTR